MSTDNFFYLFNFCFNIIVKINVLCKFELKPTNSVEFISTFKIKMEKIHKCTTDCC